jgi:predicted Zn finger-like uncharacterized protein
MIVQCEQCSKRFKLNPDLINRPEVKVRCSNCQHVFRVSKPEPPDVLELATAPQEIESQPVTRRTPRRGLVLLFIPVLLILGGIAAWLYLPWPLRPKPVPEPTGIEQLTLVETSGYFVDNQQDGQLFVIQGRVRNEFPEAKRWIHLRAKLYTTDGRTARQQDFYAGNKLSDQQLQSMPLQALLVLVQRRPTTEERARVIAAQGEVSFTVPFGNLPELTKLSDYSVEIIASQPS